jgi:roadblock/LC7 domain-containing protein
MKTPIEENVTLKGGIGAGTFKKMGKVTEMKSCIHLCCKEMSCDVAFMSAQNCYAVECVSDDECESTTTDTSDVQVLIAHVKKVAKKSCKYFLIFNQSFVEFLIFNQSFESIIQ